MSITLKPTFLQGKTFSKSRARSKARWRSNTKVNAALFRTDPVVSKSRTGLKQLSFSRAQNGRRHYSKTNGK